MIPFARAGTQRRTRARTESSPPPNLLVGGLCSTPMPVTGIKDCQSPALRPCRNRWWHAGAVVARGDPNMFTVNLPVMRQPRPTRGRDAHNSYTQSRGIPNNRVGHYPDRPTPGPRVRPQRRVAGTGTARRWWQGGTEEVRPDDGASILVDRDAPGVRLTPRWC
jgi:hypothetical protein